MCYDSKDFSKGEHHMIEDSFIESHVTKKKKKNIVLINSYNPKDIQKNYLKDIDTIKLKSNLYHNSNYLYYFCTTINRNNKSLWKPQFKENRPLSVLELTC